jgi:HD superfamily phosphodiesterase
MKYFTEGNKNMNNSLIESISIIVEEACKSKNNIFGYGIWSHHIVPMIKLGHQLAKDYEADIEIVTIAILLHDLAGIKDQTKREKHHIYGSEEAGIILESYNYPKNRIELIQKCIKNHRGSVNNKKGSSEEICVADIDAMAHISEIGSLFYVVYKEMGMDIEQGNTWIKDKIKRDWNKMSEKGRIKFQNKYDQIIDIL